MMANPVPLAFPVCFDFVLQDLPLALEERGSSFAKVYYYGASSLIWLPGAEDARTAERRAEMAIRLFSTEPADSRSLSDELLANVYLATARLNQEEVEGITGALAPVLVLPIAQRTAWHRKRVQRIIDSLRSARFGKSAAAAQAAGTLDEFVRGQ